MATQTASGSSDPSSVKNGDSDLQLLSRLAASLERARTVQDYKRIRDQAAAFRLYAKSVRARRSQANRAAEIMLRAERKAGGLLQSMRLRGGDRKSNGCRLRLTLADLGVSPGQSKRWQKMASIPDEMFERFLRDAERGGAEVTAAALLRFGRHGGRSSNREGERALQQTGTPMTVGMAMAEEIAEHCRMLAGILAPFECQDDTLQFNAIERRTVVRLLREISRLSHRMTQRHDV